MTPRLFSAWWPAFGWAGFVFILSAIPGTQLPNVPGAQIDKVVHAAIYVVMGLLCLRGVRRASALTGGRAVIMAACIAALYGVTDELHQIFTPNRSPDWHDAVADAVGGLLGALLAEKVRSTRARAAKARQESLPAPLE